MMLNILTKLHGPSSSIISARMAHVEAQEISPRRKRPHQAAVRIAERGAKSARAEIFQRLLRQGETASRAHSMAEKIYDKSVDEFTQMAAQRSSAGKTITEKDRLMMELTDHCKETVSGAIERQFAHEYDSHEEELQNEYLEERRGLLAKVPTRLGKRMVMPSKSYKPIFSRNSEQQPKIIDNLMDLHEKPLPIWRDWDNQKAQIIGQSMGPRNTWEQHIDWTRRGMMWPFPIDNDYMLGEEEQTSFVDHVFLESELAKHNLPRSKPVMHFMELVLVGLSRNPYMSVKKKHEHIKWYADYFKDVMSGKYKELL